MYKNIPLLLVVLFIFLGVFSLSVFACDPDNVSGDENGRSVGGTIYSNNEECSVSGELPDDHGNTYDFNGQWDEYGRTSGEMGDGVTDD